MHYLHQLDLLNLLPALVGSVTVPPAVVEELSEGQRLGINLPNPCFFFDQTGRFFGRRLG